MVSQLEIVLGSAFIAFLVGLATLPVLDGLMRHAAGGIRGKLWWIVGAAGYGATVLFEHQHGYDLLPATVHDDGTWTYEWDGETHEATGATFRLGFKPFAISYEKSPETMQDLERDGQVDPERAGHDSVVALSDGGSPLTFADVDDVLAVDLLAERVEGYGVDLINVWNQMRSSGGLSVIERAKATALRNMSGRDGPSYLMMAGVWALLFLLSWTCGVVVMSL